MSGRPPMRPILEVRDEVGESQLLKQLRAGQRPADRRDSHDYGKFHEIDRRLWLDDLKAKEVMTYGTLPGWDSKIVPTVLLPFSGVVACPVFVGLVQADSPKPGGPKPKYDREAAKTFLRQFIRDHGLTTSITARGMTAKLVARLERWFDKTTGEIPSDSWLKDLVHDVVNEFAAQRR